MTTRAFAPIGALMLLASCGEYVRTNPYDPLVPVDVAILGVDTVVSLGPTVPYTYKATPDLPGAIPEWSSSAPGTLQALGTAPGVFRAYHNGSAVISVTVGPHVQSKTVIVQQRFDRFIFDCRQFLGQDPICGLSLEANGGSAGFPIVAADAGRSFMAPPVPMPSPFLVVSRNAAVAGAQLDGNTRVLLTARARGLTYIVLFSGTAADSIAMTVF